MPPTSYEWAPMVSPAGPLTSGPGCLQAYNPPTDYFPSTLNSDLRFPTSFFFSTRFLFQIRFLVSFTNYFFPFLKALVNHQVYFFIEIVKNPPLRSFLTNRILSFISSITNFLRNSLPPLIHKLIYIFG